MSLIPTDERLRPLDTVFNLRDFGGYAGADGRAVVTGRLFRSAHLAKVSEAEAAVLDGLQLDYVADFRHAPERVKQPSVWSGGAVVLTQPAGDETLEVAPHEAFVREHMHSPEDARGYMMRSYAKRLSDPSFIALHRAALEGMTAQGQGDMPPGILVHCAAGKDRTGTFVALVQKLLGVSEDDVMADYLLTREAVDIEAILEPAAAMYSKRHGRPFTADTLRPMFGVDADYLDAAFAPIGPVEAYATDVLGLSEAQLDTLRARYLG